MSLVKKIIVFGEFKPTDSDEFIEYLSNMKEPKDYITFIEDIIKFRHKDNIINFFEYYHKKYLLAKPKMFIYGKFDLVLRPFMPSSKKGFENFYRGCGNAEIHYGSYNHLITEKPLEFVASDAVKNKKALKLIFKFLDNHI